MDVRIRDTITINSETFRMIPEDAFLALQSLARQARANVKVVKNRAIPAKVEEEHQELAIKALALLGE